jgi:hypothetical protein
MKEEKIKWEKPELVNLGRSASGFFPTCSTEGSSPGQTQIDSP